MVREKPADVTMRLAPDQWLSRNEGVPHTELDGELIFMSVPTGRYFSLGRMERYIWELLAVPQTVDTLLSQLAERYPVGRARIEADLIPFLGAMTEAGLLHCDAASDLSR